MIEAHATLVLSCLKDIITGKKLCSLAITEPNAGSDVAALQTTAVKEGNVYVSHLKAQSKKSGRASTLNPTTQTLNPEPPNLIRPKPYNPNPKP